MRTNNVLGICQNDYVHYFIHPSIHSLFIYLSDILQEKQTFFYICFIPNPGVGPRDITVKKSVSIKACNTLWKAKL